MTNGKLAGNVAFVTGEGGLGSATCQTLAAHGGAGGDWLA